MPGPAAARRRGLTCARLAGGAGVTVRSRRRAGAEAAGPVLPQAARRLAGTGSGVRQ